MWSWNCCVDPARSGVSAATTALARPVRFDATGRLARALDVDAIEQSLREIVGTEQGERELRPEFGVRLRKLHFMPNDQGTAEAFLEEIRTGIRRWERRVLITADRYEQEGRELAVTIGWALRMDRTRQGNTTFNFTLEGA